MSESKVTVRSKWQLAEVPGEAWQREMLGGVEAYRCVSPGLWVCVGSPVRSELGYEIGHDPRDDNWTLVSSPEPQVEAPAGVDWDLWLPPLPLPYGPPKGLLAGQVWAYRGQGDRFGAVSRITAGPTEMRDAQAVLLTRGVGGADAGTGQTYGPGGVMRHAILVQDVGQPAPTPPAELWRRAYGVCGAVRARGTCTNYKGHAAGGCSWGFQPATTINTPWMKSAIAPARPGISAPVSPPPPPVTCKATGCSVTVGLSARQWCVVHHEHDELEARAAAYGNVTIDVRKPLPPLVFEPYEPTWGSRGGLGSWRRR